MTAAARGKPARRLGKIAHHEEREQRRRPTDEEQVLPAERRHEPAAEHRGREAKDGDRDRATLRSLQASPTREVCLLAP